LRFASDSLQSKTVKALQVLRLPRSKVHIGAPLLWNVRDERGNLLLAKGYVVANERQLDELLERGAFVDIEEIKAAAQTQAPTDDKKGGVPESLFDRWEKQPEALRRLCLDAPTNADFVQQLDAFADRLLVLLDANADVAIYRTVRQENQALFYYGYTHAIHTAALCALLARHLKWPNARTMSLFKAALTMNLSIMELQGQMAAQDVPIRDAQKKEIQEHPQQSVQLLESLGVTDADWLGAIAEHHENPDGSGYPKGSTTPGEMATALRVCDIFMAKISPRSLRDPLTSQEAIRQLYREDQGGPISTAIIKQFGIYPPGDFVKLASGELGIVAQRTSNAKAPIVAVITDTQGQMMSKTVRRDSAQAGFAIIGNEVNKILLKRLPAERIYGFLPAPR